jgi:hypothetical protein
VIGYTGQGAREYWDAPNFLEIQQGDLRSFVAASAQAAQEIDGVRLTYADLAPGIASLAERFSPSAEAASLRVILGYIEGCFASAPAAASVPELV